MRTIIDTSALLSLYLINRVSQLNSIFNNIHIPITVEQEFLSETLDPKIYHSRDDRYQFLSELFEQNLWVNKCQSYNDEIIDILKTDENIDGGERETIAQYIQLQDDLKLEEGQINCIIDEKYARSVAENMQIKINGTLYLLARLHFNGYIDYHDETQKLKRERRFKDSIINAAFEKVKIELGLN